MKKEILIGLEEEGDDEEGDDEEGGHIISEGTTVVYIFCHILLQL